MDVEICKMIYCATSFIEGLEVDHLFDAETDEAAIEFATAQGWYFVEEDVTFRPWVPEIVK